MSNLISPSRNLEIEPPVLSQLLNVVNIHICRDSFFLKAERYHPTRSAFHSVKQALPNLEGGGGIESSFGPAGASRPTAHFLYPAKLGSPVT